VAPGVSVDSAGMVKAYLIFVLLAMTAIIVASRWLPVWAAFILIPGAFLFFVWFAIALIKYGARNLLQSTLEEQSLVMQGATVTIHGVAPCQAPKTLDDAEDPGEFEDDEYEWPEEDDGRYVRIEMTVHPDPGSVATSREKLEVGGGKWMPVMFSLMLPGVVLEPKRTGVMAMFSIPQARAVEAERVDGVGATDEDGDLQIEGQARVRVTFAVPPELDGRVAVRYHLLELAEITLPADTAGLIES